MNRKCWNCGNTRFKKIIQKNKIVYKCSKCKAEKPKIWKRSEVRSLILTGRKDVICRAILAISKNQTFNELINGESKGRNYSGFNALDAKYFTSKLSDGFTRLSQIERFINSKFNPKLDPFKLELNLEYIRNRALNYSGQLAKIATCLDRERVESKFDSAQLKLF